MLHHLIRAEDVLGTPGHGKALENGVNDGVDEVLRLLRVRMDVDELHGLVWLPIHRQGFCHATERHRTRVQSTGSNLLLQLTRSTSFICPKDLIIAPKMGAETFDDMQGKRFRKCDRGFMCCNLLQASTAAERKAS